MTMRVPLLAIVLMWASSASGQSLSGVPRLSLATPLFELAHVDNSGRDARDVSATRLAVGPRSALGFGFGIGVSERLIVGADVWLGYASFARASEVDAFGAGSGSGQQFNVFRVTPVSGYPFPLAATWSAQVAPYLELVTGRGSVRPLLALAGLVGFQRDTLELAYTSQSLTDHVNALQLGGSLIGGAHFFVSDAISFDAALRMTYAYTAWFVGYDQAASSVGLAITLGFSGWIY